MMQFLDPSEFLMSSPMKSSLFYDTLSYILQFGLGDVVNTAEEEDDLFPNLVN